MSGQRQGRAAPPAREFRVFCDRVCSMVRWKAARDPIARELTAHLEDHAAALMDQGVPEAEANARAVAAMGEPYALGSALDAAHSPRLLNLSRLLLLIGALVLALGLILGLRDGTGLFALSGVFPRAPDPPCESSHTVVLEGSASGGGVLGDYTFTPSGEAVLTRVRWDYDEDRDGAFDETYQIQVPLTVSSNYPWLPAPETYRPGGSWTDDAGGSGALAGGNSEDYLLGGSGWLRIVDPTPGARTFTLTLSALSDTIHFTVTLPEEVPPL